MFINIVFYITRLHLCDSSHIIFIYNIGESITPIPQNRCMWLIIAKSINNNKAFLSQARWGRLEMKPRMKTSELNPQ
jgi:hypothetical protein